MVYDFSLLSEVHNIILLNTYILVQAVACVFVFFVNKNFKENILFQIKHTLSVCNRNAFDKINLV